MLDPKKKILDLRARGMTFQAMMRQSGLAHETLRRISTGQIGEPRQGTREIIDRLTFEPALEIDGKRLLAARQALGISAPALANASGIKDPSTIYSWENGRTTPKDRTVFEKMLAILGVDIQAIATGSGADEDKEIPLRVGRSAGDDSILSPYPCHVCGQEFRSRRLLATHPHPKKGTV